MSNTDKKAADQKSAASKEATTDAKVATTADVTNANENPEFSKVEGKEATDTRVSQVGPSEQLGSTKQTPDADLAAREQQLDEREKLLDKREAKIEEKEAADAEKVTPGLAFTFEKQKYKFADSAPKKLRIAGQKLTQKEIAANDELLLDLIGGNSALIQKL